MASPFTPLSPNRVARGGRQRCKRWCKCQMVFKGLPARWAVATLDRNRRTEVNMGTDDAIADPYENGVEACRDIAVLLGALTG